jgi:hypothetical protein
VTRVARRAHVLRVLRELGAGPEREAAPEHALEFRQALEELGTTFVKLGQILSSRPDLPPDVYIDELEGLVDGVPPVPFAELRPVIEGEVGPGVFAEIDEEPLAGASIAQIHPGLLANGREVVVKVRRPGVGEQVEVDLGLLRSAAGLAEGRSETARRLLAGLFMQLEPLARVPRQVGQIATKLDAGTLKVGIAPKELDGLDRVLRSTANRLGAALIVVGLLVSSALMARVSDAVALAGFAASAAIALYMVWKIL